MRGKILPSYSDGRGGHEKHAVGHGKKNNSDNHTENENAENAVIKCKDGAQLTVNGDGEIIINASGKKRHKDGRSGRRQRKPACIEGNL